MSTVGGKTILFSGSVIMQAIEPSVFIDGGAGVTLSLAWDRDEPNSATGGSYNAITGNFPAADLGERRSYGFGLGLVGQTTRSVRVSLEPVNTFDKIVTYTVVEEPA